MQEGLVEALLRHIFGILPVTGYPLCHCKNSPFITTNQFLKSSRISILGGSHQGTVGGFADSVATNDFHDFAPRHHLVTSNSMMKMQSLCQRRSVSNNTRKLLATWGVLVLSRLLGHIEHHAELSECWHSVYSAG